MTADRPTVPPPSFHPVPNAMRPLHPDSSTETMFHALQEALANYANMAATLNHNLPVILAALSDIRHEMGQWKAERADIVRRLDSVTLRSEDHSSRLRLLELGPMRAEVKSHHSWDEELSRLDKELSRRVKDAKDPMDSIRAKEIAAEVVKAAEDRHELTTWRLSKGWAARVLTEAVKGAILLLLGFAASRLLH